MVIMVVAVLEVEKIVGYIEADKQSQYSVIIVVIRKPLGGLIYCSFGKSSSLKNFVLTKT